MRCLTGGIALLLVLVLIALPVYASPDRQGGPQPIAYGQVVTGDLTPQRPEALYIFAAQLGDVLTITMDVVEGNIDPLLILVDESQQSVLAVGNDSSYHRTARLRFIVPSPANYIIRVTTVQGSGEIKGKYKLALSLGNPTPTPSPTTSAPLIAPLGPGEAVQGDLGDAVRFHLYAVRARQGDPIAASLEIAGNPPVVQAGMYLYTDDFREIGRAELGEALSLQAPADGLYFLVVARAATSGAGLFTLRYGAAGGPSGISITVGRTVQGTITADNAVKTYSLQGTSGQVIVARMRRLSGDLAVYLYVVAIDSGKALAQATGENGVAELSTVLPTDGTYAIVATREGKQAGTTTGDYALTVAPPGNAAPVPPVFQGYMLLQYGDRVSGAIDDTVYAVPYVFAAEAGDVVQATMTASGGSDLSPHLILQNTNGDTIVEEGSSATQPGVSLQTTIAQAGYYGLIATRDGLAKGKTQGEFDLTLSVLDPSQAAGSGHAAQGTLLIAGQSHTGAIGPQIASLFRFEAQANMAITIDVSPAAGLEVVTILADSNFQEIARATTGPIRSTLLPHAGTYFVFVVRRGGPNDPSVGAYSLMLQGAVNPGPTALPAALIYGQPVTGTIGIEVYQVRYTIDARQGTTLLITMDAVPGSTLDPMVALLDANNNLLAANDNASQGVKNAALIYDVPRGGQYVVLATRSQEAVGTSVGAYTLKVELRQPATPTPVAAAPTRAAPEIIPIRYGGTASGTINAQRFLYYYTFEGNAGDVITIRMSRVPGTQLDPLLYLYVYSDGKPALVASNNDLAAGNPDAGIVKFKLPQPGPYLIVATRLGAAQGQTEGSFILTLDRDE